MNAHIFHLYNRANDRHTLFREDDNYRFFIKKMGKQLTAAVHILGYCVMPNHFHVLVALKTPLRKDFIFGKEFYNQMPTPELSEAVRRWLMGYTKSHNKYYGLTGSRFQQHTRATYHLVGSASGLRYIHQNPVEAGLVVHPSEWGYSSYLEYEGLIAPEDCICNIELGKKLLLVRDIR
ncbi:MAG: hypothetical protein AAF741_07325 [Bacteroidota bacterium]